MDTDRIEWIIQNPKDFYNVLQVTKDADNSSIRRSYYRLALQLHPDKNNGDERAGVAFRIVTDAYNTLSEPMKRSAFDRYGSKGFEAFERMSEFSMSLSDLFRAIGLFALYRIIRSIAERGSYLECAEERFPWVREYRDAEASWSSSTGDSQRSVNKELHYTFAQEHKTARAFHRRRAIRWFLFCSTIIFLLLGGLRRTFSVTQPSTNAPISPLVPTSQWRICRRSTRVVRPFFFDCWKKDTNLTVQCHKDRVVGEVDSPRLDPAPSIWFAQYSGDAMDGIAAFHRYLEERCSQEALLHWASYERYRPTATVRRRTPLPTPQSPNKAAKRKFKQQVWRPKFYESFSVENASDLYELSPLCSHWWGSGAPEKVAVGGE